MYFLYPRKVVYNTMREITNTLWFLINIIFQDNCRFGPGMMDHPHPHLHATQPSCPVTADTFIEPEDDLFRVLRILLEKEDQQNKDDQIRREWRLLAEIIDRWLFWGFFLITTISTAIFILILPYSKRGKFFWDIIFKIFYLEKWS